jgi:hypothetical protein
MTRAEQETTARIDRNSLRGLLEESGATPRPKRRRPFSHVAAQLGGTPQLPRATRPPPVARAYSPEELKAARALADVRARLDRAEETAAQRAADCERGSFPVLSPQIVGHLSGEEIAMLPMEIRLTLPEPPSWYAGPRIELTPVPSRPYIVTPPTAERIPTRVLIMACVAGVFWLSFCAYWLL